MVEMMEDGVANRACEIRFARSRSSVNAQPQRSDVSARKTRRATRQEVAGLLRDAPTRRRVAAGKPQAHVGDAEARGWWMVFHVGAWEVQRNSFLTC